MTTHRNATSVRVLSDARRMSAVAKRQSLAMVTSAVGRATRTAARISREPTKQRMRSFQKS
jgi:hypothetical protein